MIRPAQPIQNIVYSYPIGISTAGAWGQAGDNFAPFLAAPFLKGAPLPPPGIVITVQWSSAQRLEFKASANRRKIGKTAVLTE